MKARLMLLWALLLSFGVGLSAVDLDNILDDADKKKTEEGDKKEVKEEAEGEGTEEAAEEVAEAEVVLPAPKPVDEPRVAFPAPAKPEAPAKEKDRSITYRLLMWLPNCLVDLDDCISLKLGVGSRIVVEPRVTRYLQFGGSYGDQYFLAKDYNRQYGGGFGSSWSLDLLCWEMEKTYLEDTFGTVKPYLHSQESLALPTSKMEVYKEGHRDLWAIGAAVGWLVNVEAFFHPVEFADFITGIFLYDLRGDDF